MSEPARNSVEPTAPARLDPVRAAALLANLRQAHDELAGAIAALDALTGAARPDPAAYSHARWRLSSTRRKRRAVAAEVYEALLAVAAPQEAAALASLRADDDRRLSASALHVQQWTNERIAADWPGYCAASAPLRAALRDWIGAERALLFPLLERFARVTSR